MPCALEYVPENALKFFPPICLVLKLCQKLCLKIMPPKYPWGLKYAPPKYLKSMPTNFALSLKKCPKICLKIMPQNFTLALKYAQNNALKLYPTISRVHYSLP